MVLENHPLSLIAVGVLLLGMVAYVFYSLRKDQLEKEQADQFISVTPSFEPPAPMSNPSPSPAAAIERVSSKKVLFLPPSPSSQTQGQKQGQGQGQEDQEEDKEDDDIQWSDEISERNQRSSLSGDFSAAGVWSTNSDGRSRGYSMDSLRSSDSDYTSFRIRNLSSLESADESSNESLEDISESNESEPSQE
jgi:hypothetical protein